MQSLDSETKKWLLLNQKRLEIRAAGVVKELRSSGLEPILLKGWAAARNYPSSHPRYYSDIDLAVSSKDFSAARKLIVASKGSLSGVDLHNEFRNLDSTEWIDLFARSAVVDLEEIGSIRILSPEDHLRIMATHWLNDGGTNKERLWDIYYAVANRPSTFDWTMCLESVDSVRRGWVICAIGLANRYLGLPIKDLPFSDEALSIPTWVTDALEREWASGEPLVPLQACLSDAKLFFRQVRKRIPPNPLQATIETESPIDESKRFPIQLLNMLQRITPSFGRIFQVLKRSK